MSRKISFSLTSDDRAKLEHIISRGGNWRERERAKTLVLLDDGLSMGQAADALGIHVRTVGFTRLDWLARHFASLVDAPRSGAPRKITPDQLDKILDAARSEPLTAKDLLAKHVGNGGRLVHLSTMTGALKAAGFVWKRTRHSLKKKGMKLPSDSPKLRSPCSESRRPRAISCWPMWTKRGSLRFIPIEAPGHPKGNVT